MTIFKKFKSDIIDLSYLLQASDNDNDFILMMIESFLKNNSIYLEEIKQLHKEKKYTDLYSSIHKYKGSVLIIGIIDLSELLTKAEEKSLAKENCSINLINEIEKLGNQTAKELKDFIASEKIE